jgi:AraC-like DNA-binding protein
MAPLAGDEVVESAASLRLWMDLINERFVPLQIKPSADDLAGQVTTRQVGHMQASCVNSTPQVFTRSNALLRRGRELVAVGVVDRGCGFLEQDGRRCEVSDGSFALYDTTRPFTWAFTTEFQMRVYAWPRESLGLDDSDIGRLTALTVSGTAGVGSFVAPMLDQIMKLNSGPLPGPVSVRLAEEVAELAVTAALEAGFQEGNDERTTAVLRKVQAYIEENLPDPGLTPDRIAEAFFMSTRTLHRIFAGHGLTVAAWIKDRRLERAKRSLGIAHGESPSITDLAARLGFANAAAFSRDFSLRYGVSPSHYRINRS